MAKSKSKTKKVPAAFPKPYNPPPPANAIPVTPPGAQYALTMEFMDDRCESCGSQIVEMLWVSRAEYNFLKVALAKLRGVEHDIDLDGGDIPETLAEVA